MKSYIVSFCALLILASCSSPKYAYYFDHYDYNKGKGVETPAPVPSVAERTSPILIEPVTLMASTKAEPEVEIVSVETRIQPVTTGYSSLTKAEKREIKKEAVKTMKEYIKAVKKGDTEKAVEMKKAMDSDLRWAAIFGAIGVGGLIIGGDVFGIIGGIALIIAVVFFVIWITKQ